MVHGEYKNIINKHEKQLHLTDKKHNTTWWQKYNFTITTHTGQEVKPRTQMVVCDEYSILSTLVCSLTAGLVQSNSPYDRSHKQWRSLGKQSHHLYDRHRSQTALQSSFPVHCCTTEIPLLWCSLIFDWKHWSILPHQGRTMCHLGLVRQSHTCWLALEISSHHFKH